jgi:hypothetical protein
VAVREKSVARKGAPPLVLRTYFAAALDAEPGLAEAWLPTARPTSAATARQIGDYPYEFSVVASPLPTGFGMPTLTYMGEQVLRLPFIRASSLGHEVLHNWWGNGVLVDYARGNWSEGLTTFMADYAYKAEASAAAAREMRLGWLRDFAALPADSHAPLADFRSRTHGAAAAVGYGKAAMVFVMLQDEIGEDAFARGIRLFWERQRFRIAAWDELRAAFEEAAGRPLQGFFRQWLELPGGPAPRIERARLVEPAGQGARVRVSLAQPGPVHALRLPLQLVAGDRVETRVVEFAAGRTDVELPPASCPRAWPSTRSCVCGACPRRRNCRPSCASGSSPRRRGWCLPTHRRRRSGGEWRGGEWRREWRREWRKRWHAERGGQCIRRGGAGARRPPVRAHADAGRSPSLGRRGRAGAAGGQRARGGRGARRCRPGGTAPGHARRRQRQGVDRAA